MFTLDTFYQSKEWRKFREIVIQDRLTEQGYTVCEHCGKPIVRAYDCILHHCNTFLTEDNVNDVSISLNPDNIQLLHHRCHNLVHNKLGYKRREVFLVYGAPLSGKTSWVAESISEGDLVVDMDSIWQCVSGCDRYVKPPRLNAVVFGVRDYLIESIRVRRGKWNNAYLVGGFPLCSERERLCKTLGAREIYIEASKEECLARLEQTADGRDKDAWAEFIEEWFTRFLPSQS